LLWGSFLQTLDHELFIFDLRFKPLNAFRAFYYPLINPSLLSSITPNALRHSTNEQLGIGDAAN
jgi:hypothetical protein